MNHETPRLSRYLLRGCRLRCPRCGQGRLFRGWFRMHERCAGCGLKFQREPGYYLGSIYFNYGLTALLVLFGYGGLFFLTDWPEATRLGLLLALSVLFPLWFFRYARSLWLAFDRYVDRTPE